MRSIKHREPEYKARMSRPQPKLSREMRVLIRRRTKPYLDSVGMDYSLQHLMEEAYLQGLRDAAQVFEHEAERYDG